MLVFAVGSGLYAAFMASVAFFGWRWQSGKSPEQTRLEYLVESEDEQALAYCRAIRGEPFYSQAEDGVIYALI